MQPILNFSSHMFYYFVAFIIFGVFISVNLIVSGIADHVDSYLWSMTEVQKPDSETQNGGKIVADTELDKKCCQKMSAFVSGRKFGCITFWLCVVFVLSLTVEHYQSPQSINMALSIINLVFVILLVVETVLRVVAEGKSFFKSKWNWFDLIVSILAIIGKQGSPSQLAKSNDNFVHRTSDD